MTEATPPWPHWMLRYVGSDDDTALEDLVWSVGGSPPMGGVSYEEANAVYELLESYMGPGTASDVTYETVLRLLAPESDRAQTVEIFRCTDMIQSHPDSYELAWADRGFDIARKLGHAGAEASFLSFQAGWHIHQNDDVTALKLTKTALGIFLEVAEDDGAYVKRVHQSAANMVSLTARTGNVDGARALLMSLADVMDTDIAEQLRLALRRAK